MFRTTYILAIVILGLYLLAFQLYLIHQYITELYSSDLDVPVILWWTPFGSSEQIQTCGTTQCYFTTNRSFEYHAKSILFYGSNIYVDDLPKWRSRFVHWGLLNEESPRNKPMLVYEEALNLFNYSSTFSRFSDVPLTLSHLSGIEDLLSKRHFIPTKEKSVLINNHSLAPVLYIQSDCNTASDRDLYVSNLMKYIQIDSYGLCLNNMQLHDRFKNNYLEKLDSDEFLSFVAQYKFTLAFENAVCNDYITEKLWRPLIVGSIPVYYGSPSFKDWLPNNKSAISVLDFSGPQELADFLLFLTRNDTAYEEYLSHKLHHASSVVNNRLLRAMEKRPWLNEFGNYVEEFECFICNKVHENEHNYRTSIMKKEHYDCPLPHNPLTGQIDKSNFWVKQWLIEKCVAKLLARYIPNNISIDMKQFDEQKLDLYNKNSC